MRSIHRGGFILDLGRKELYNRLDKVDKLWTQLLSDQYRPYAHRGGILYDGRIIDSLPQYRGIRRGMPWRMFIGMGLDFLWWRMKPAAPPKNLQDKYYRQRGRMMTRTFSQGFQEKLTGRKWADAPVDAIPSNGEAPGLISTAMAAWKRAFSTVEPNTYKGIWRHPAKGTGQICDLMEQGIRASGGRIEFESQITAIDVADGKFKSIDVKTGSETIRFKPEHVVASIPIEALLALLPGGRDRLPAAPTKRIKNTVVLVYLFLNHPPKFPHPYLQVTCPRTRIGRITNYAAYSREMTPPGQTSLCCELYCFGEDELLTLTDKEIANVVLHDCATSHLIDPDKCFDHLVLRLPGADASQNRHNWINQQRLALISHLDPYRNVYYTQRTELDIATLAGMEAGEAILSGDRSEFDHHIDPEVLGIRSESKAFAFA